MLDRDQIILDVVRKDPRFSAEAYHFLLEALDFTLKRRGEGRKHVTGPEILEGVRDLALETFGFLARAVLQQWGIRRTDDFGAVVFNLIDVDLLQKTADDRLEDFVAYYEFSRAFDTAFTESLQSVEI
jgi:uncharacterized repeat protein (TIGR04138 family)